MIVGRGKITSEKPDGHDTLKITLFEIHYFLERNIKKKPKLLNSVLEDFKKANTVACFKTNLKTLLSEKALHF